MDFPFAIISGISFTSEGFAHLVFFVMALATAVISVILFFHWRKYGMGGKVLAFTEAAYLAGAVLFLVTAFFAIR